MLVTVQTITDSAIDLADMRNSRFVDVSGSAGTELIRYVNMAYKDIYQQIILSKENYFVTNTTIAVTGGTSSYSLPADFYKLNGVDLQLDSSGRYLTLTPFMFKERNKYRSGLAIPLSPYGSILKYIIAGSTIQFLPIPANSATVQLWYTPEPATITSLATSLSLPIGCDEYMSLYVACAILGKEESETTLWQGKMAQIIDQLKNSLKDRDYGSASYVIDESSINIGALYPFIGTE